MILVGSDPEVFLRVKGKPVSAFNVIPGTKYNPFMVKKGAIQVDGMALEFNIEPAKTKQEFITNHIEVMQQLQRHLPPNSSIRISPIQEFSKEYLEEQPKEALLLGCDPDFNAHTGKHNQVPDGNVNFRVAAGHIHIGWRDDNVDPMNETHFQDCILVAQELDMALALPALKLDSLLALKRRSMYGKAGSFRPKSYGLEYRTLSNFWIKNPELMGWVYDRVIKVMEKMFDTKHRIIGNFYGVHKIRNTINSSYGIRREYLNFCVDSTIQHMKDEEYAIY